MNALKCFFEQLRSLDPRDVGRWPLLFRALAVGLVFAIATGLLVWLTPLLPTSNDMGEFPRRAGRA